MPDRALPTGIGPHMTRDPPTERSRRGEAVTRGLATVEVASTSTRSSTGFSTWVVDAA